MAEPQASFDPSVVKNQWYLPTPTTFPPVALEVFKKHTNLPEDEIIPHIIAVREKAWKIFPYPCIGTFRFLDFSISESHYYDTIVSRLKSGKKFLDLGCCLGQDIRKLISDGVPSTNTYGAELRPEFISMGYDLFLDKETIQTTFLTPVDIFDESESSPLSGIEGKIDIIYIGSFLHMFSYDDQVRAAKRINKILSKKKGSMVVGRQAGAVVPGERTHVTNIKATMYRHNLETFEKFWNEDIGGLWEVDVDFKEIEPIADVTGEGKEPAFSDKQSGWLRFSVKRARV